MTRPVVVLPDPGFADEGEDLAALDRQVDPVDRSDVHRRSSGERVDEARPDREVDLETLEPDQLGHGCWTAGWTTGSSRPPAANGGPPDDIGRADGDGPIAARDVEMAGDAHAVRIDDLRRLDLTADVHRRRAARIEPAADRRVAQVRRRAGDRLEAAPVGVDVRECAEELLRVRVSRRPEDPRDRTLLGDLAGVHDQGLVAGLGDDRQVVGDQDERQAELASETLEQLEDLRLDHDVERGRRLVADDDRRVAGEGHRDHRPLAHPARQLVRVGRGAPARDPDELEQLGSRACASCRATARGGPRSARRSGRRSVGPG